MNSLGASSSWSSYRPDAKQPNRQTGVEDMSAVLNLIRAVETTGGQFQNSIQKKPISPRRRLMRNPCRIHKLTVRMKKPGENLNALW